MSAQKNQRDRRLFTADEFQKMLDEGIVAPEEDATLHDGLVWVTGRLAQRFRESTDPGPYGGTVPQDQVLAEVPLVSQTRHEETRAMATQLTGAPAVPGVHEFTVDEYYRLTEVGILSQDERSELIEGAVIVMAAIGSKHASCVDGFTKAFSPLATADRVVLRIQNPLFLDEHTELQPDIALVRLASYAEAHPRPDDVLLLIEVADTTIGYDRGHKLPLYARSGIPETWLADVNDQSVEVHAEPRDGVYTSVQRVGMDGVLTPAALPDVGIAIKDVFRW